MQPFGGLKVASLYIPNGDVDIDAAGRELFGSRLFVVTADEAADQYVGQIVMPVWDRAAVAAAQARRGSVRYTPSMVRMVRFADIYFAFRGLTHGTETYEQDALGEIPRMSDALRIATALQAVLLGLSSANAEELEKEIVGLIETAIGLVNPNARLVQKKEILHHLSAMGKLRDSRNRLNPTVLLTRLVAVIARLAAREINSGTIDAIYTQRRKAAQTCIQLLEAHAQYAQRFLEQSLGNWDTIVQSRRHILAHHLETSADAFTTIDVLPFRATFQYAHGEFRQAAMSLRTGAVEYARSLLQRSAVGFALRTVRIELEHAYFPLSRALHLKQPLDIERTQAALAECAKMFDTLDTSNLQLFDRSTVLAGIQHATSRLQTGKLNDAQLALQQTLRLL